MVRERFRRSTADEVKIGNAFERLSDERVFIANLIDALGVVISSRLTNQEAGHFVDLAADNSEDWTRRCGVRKVLNAYRSTVRRALERASEDQQEHIYAQLGLGLAGVISETGEAYGAIAELASGGIFGEPKLALGAVVDAVLEPEYASRQMGTPEADAEYKLIARVLVQRLEKHDPSKATQLRETRPYLSAGQRLIDLDLTI